MQLFATQDDTRLDAGDAPPRTGSSGEGESGPPRARPVGKRFGAHGDANRAGAPVDGRSESCEDPSRRDGTDETYGVAAVAGPSKGAAMNGRNGAGGSGNGAGEPSASGAGGACGAGAGKAGVDVSVLAEIDVRFLDDSELDARMRELHRVADRAKGLIAQALAEKSRRAHKGAVLTGLQEGLGMSARKARKTLKQAEQLEDLPATRDALVNNLINTEHADILGSAAKSGPVDEGRMLKAAQTQTPEKFRKTLREHQRELDRDDGAAELQRQRKQRCASFTEREDGMWQLYALFDHITAAGVRRALARSGAVWDNRSGSSAIGQRHRRADTLADILTGPKPAPRDTSPGTGTGHETGDSVGAGAGRRKGGSGTGLPGNTSGTGARCSSSLDANPPGTAHPGSLGAGKSGAGGSGTDGSDCALWGAGVFGANANDSGAPTTLDACSCRSTDSVPGQARRGRSSSTGSASRPEVVVVADWDLINAKLDNPRLSDGTSLPADEFHHLACEADVLPALFSSATGEPMWLGRRRHPSPALRAVLEARDGGCIGCGTAPEWCVSHHTVPWGEDGPTQPDNLTLVCHDCHYKIHHQGWTVDKPRNQRHQIRPPNPRSP